MKKSTVWAIPVEGLLALGYLRVYSSKGDVPAKDRVRAFPVVIHGKSVENPRMQRYLVWDKSNGDVGTRWTMRYAWIHCYKKMAVTQREIHSRSRTLSDLSAPIPVSVGFE